MNTRRRTWKTYVTAGALLFAPAQASALPGDLATKWPIDDENPSAFIPDQEARNKDPLEFGYFLQDLIARGEGAFTEKKYEEAIRYYEALSKAVPDRAISFRRLCSSYERLGKLRKAEASCWALLKRKGVVVEDHLHLMRLALAQISEGAPAVTEERTRMIDASADHVRKHLTGTAKNDVAKLDATKEGLGDSEELDLPLQLQVELIQCRLAIHLRDTIRLQQCVDGLQSNKADPKLVIPFQWTYALAKGDQTRMDQVLADAKKFGMPENAIKAMADGPKTLPPRADNTASTEDQAVLLEPSDNGKPPTQAAAPAFDAGTEPAPRGFDIETWIAGLAALLGVGAGGWLAWQKLGYGRRNPAARPSV